MAMLETAAPSAPTKPMFDIVASEPDARTGFRRYELGQFKLERDEYFVTVSWPTRQGRMQHRMSADAFLRALMRDVAWGFFYGLVNFDGMFGSRNLYGRVEFFAGRYDESYHSAGLSYVEEFDSPFAMATCRAILKDWCNAGFDPFAAPEETGPSWAGSKSGDNLEAIERSRVATRRMPGLPGDSPLRDELPINRAFADVSQEEPVIEAAPGFEGKLHAFSLFKYLSRSDVTWNPSVTSVCRESLYCPTTEEYILPIIHGNDRVEWFIQLSDEIEREVADKETGKPRARVLMKAGDVSAMPADIRHRGFSTKRSMLLVWENARMDLPKLYE
ncbi:MAG: hydroxyquinol 1,2-dioxygenase, partial [Burkholderiales bacterium 12-64-5]